jgi:hypothetical protein
MSPRSGTIAHQLLCLGACLLRDRHSRLEAATLPLSYSRFQIVRQRYLRIVVAAKPPVECRLDEAVSIIFHCPLVMDM